MNDLNEDALKTLVKITCGKVGEDIHHKVAAAAVGVSEGRWSHYHSTDAAHREKGIPLWRAIAFEKRTGRRDFSRLFEQAGVAAAVSCDPRAITGTALSLIATITTTLNEALEDDDLCDRERVELLTLADRLCDTGARLKERLASNVKPLRVA